MIGQAIIFALFVAALSSIGIACDDEGRISGKRTLRMFLVTTILATIVLSFLYYLFPPAIVGIWGGWGRLLIGPMIVVSLVWAVIYKDSSIAFSIQALKIVVAVGAFLYILMTPVFFADELYSVPVVKEFSNNSSAGKMFDPIELDHIRLVDRELAYSLGSNVMGAGESLGSVYKVEPSGFHMMNVSSHSYWAAALEYQGFWKWSARHYTPGYIIVDAEDPFATAQLKDDYHFKYVSSAYLDENLQRYIYSQGYSHCKIEDVVFELDDAFAPRYTISITKPTVVNEGDVVQSLLVLDPESGKIDEYALDEIPAWVDRAIPERIAKQNMGYRGKYVHGWWNYGGFFSTDHRDVNIPTCEADTGCEELFFVYASGNRPYWFGGMTSQSSTDHSLTSITLTDARSGVMYPIKMSGANEAAALGAVNSKFSAYPNWYATTPIPHDVYGTLTYIVPYTAHEETGVIFQGVGFVDASNKHAEIGATKEEAAENYRKYLATKGIKINIDSRRSDKTINGDVVRMGSIASQEGSSNTFLLNESDLVFAVDASLFPEASLTQVSDSVEIGYSDTGGALVVAKQFDNLEFETREIASEKNNTTIDQS